MTIRISIKLKFNIAQISGDKSIQRKGPTEGKRSGLVDKSKNGETIIWQSEHLIYANQPRVLPEVVIPHIWVIGVDVTISVVKPIPSVKRRFISIV
jgi:hypothetical protein